MHEQIPEKRALSMRDLAKYLGYPSKKQMENIFFKNHNLFLRWVDKAVNRFFRAKWEAARVSGRIDPSLRFPSAKMCSAIAKENLARWSAPGGAVTDEFGGKEWYAYNWYLILTKQQQQTGGVFEDSTASDENKQLLIWHALRNYLNAKHKQVKNAAERPPGTVNVDEHPFSSDDGTDQDDVDDDDDLEVTTLPTLKDLQIVGEHATTKEKASVVM
jgi:hypothetical protein